MTAIKIDTFQGISPRTASELLPERFAQVANNVRVTSGNLIPYTQPVIDANTGRTGKTETIFGIRDITRSRFEWLAWGTDVDVVIITDAYREASDAVVRFYYTGDGKPKSSTFDIAVDGSKPYPAKSYDLGLPLPDTKLTATRIGSAGDNARPRTYIYTWLTPFGEESIPSEPSNSITANPDVSASVANLPTEPPTGNNFIRGVRLYRTITTRTGSEFFRLRTLWFPAPLAKVSRENNIATVTMKDPHNLIVDDRFKIQGASESSFNVTGGSVTEIVNRNTFRFEQNGADLAETIETNGTLFHDVSESLDDSARYWGDNGDFDFLDDFDQGALSSVIESANYDPPPDELKGLISAQNNILAGFVGNRLFFSEPRRPHAWPAQFALTFPYTIIGIESVQGQIIVLTDSYPYRVFGSQPEVMTFSRVDDPYPCVSKKSIVNIGGGVIFSSNGGLVEYSPNTGTTLITEALFDWDTWNELLDPTTVKGFYYEGRYFATHSKGSFIFAPDRQGGGVFITVDEQFDTAWDDPVSDKFYYAKGTDGDIYSWNEPDQPFQVGTWRSRTIRLDEFSNMAAARVIADYEDSSDVWDATEINWEDKTSPWDIDGNLLFELYVDKQLIFQRVLSDSKTFKLPIGYKSDRFSVSISGSVRIRGIHLATAASELKRV